MFAQWLLVAMLAARPAKALEPPPASRRPLTLEQAFASALARSEDLAARADGIAELNAKIGELLAAALPRLSLKGSETFQDQPPPDPSGFSNSFNQSPRPEMKFQLGQPIFSGLREYLAVKAAKLQGSSAELELKRARSLLYQDVASAYIELLRRQREMDTRRTVLKIHADRVKELKERGRLGRSRPSEILAAQSQEAQFEAQLESVRAAEALAQETLRFLTGISEELAPADRDASSPAPLDAFLARAQARPDVESKRRLILDAALQMDIARRERWPTMRFDGDYYLRRVGIQSGVRWDAMLSAELPLFYGGAISSRVEQARARSRAGAQALSAVLRRAEMETRSAYRDLELSLSSTAALKKALDLAEANARAQQADYRLGLVTNLDVLGSLSALQETRVQWDQARLRSVLARARLEVAAGGAEVP